MADLADAAALVTGAGSGIGRATAELLGRRGARVFVADIRAGAVDETVEIVRANGGAAQGAEIDLTSPEQVEDMLAQVVAAYGRLDVAVNNAGVTGTYSSVVDCTIEDWRRTLDINLTSVFLCLRAEIPRMLEGGGGAICNTSSGAGLMGFPGLPAYVASKHGVIGLTRTAALENAKKGIRVNAVCPGTIRTPMLEGFTGGDEKALAGMGAMMPIGRLGTPAEIAESIVWLCSPAASYVTGHALAVDGGAAAQ